MNNLILVRHGQSKYNLERRFTGFYDIDLTLNGKAEAEKAGNQDYVKMNKDSLKEWGAM